MTLARYHANGNVTQVVDCNHDPNDPNGAIVARYEYDPFGKITAQSGPYADENPFRFSTKDWDDETGLGYWGYRYCDPKLGRWMSPDPIGEWAGINPYSYVRNRVICGVDPVGRMWLTPHESDDDGDCKIGEKCYKVEMAVMPGYGADPGTTDAAAIALAILEAVATASAISSLAESYGASACLLPTAPGVLRLSQNWTSVESV